MGGFPVEVFIVDEHLIDRRTVGKDNGPIYQTMSDLFYKFTFEPDDQNNNIFCDYEGQRENSIAWGISLDPVPRQGNVPTDVMQASALYIETTGAELANLIRCLQDLYDWNFKEDGTAYGSFEEAQAGHEMSYNSRGLGIAQRAE